MAANKRQWTKQCRQWRANLDRFAFHSHSFAENRISDICFGIGQQSSEAMWIFAERVIHPINGQFPST